MGHCSMVESSRGLYEYDYEGDARLPVIRLLESCSSLAINQITPATFEH